MEKDYVYLCWEFRIFKRSGLNQGMRQIAWRDKDERDPTNGDWAIFLLIMML
jgi:hypothetical protein